MEGENPSAGPQQAMSEADNSTFLRTFKLGTAQLPVEPEEWEWLEKIPTFQ